MLSAIAVAVVVGKLMFAGIPAPEWSASGHEHESLAASIGAGPPYDDTSESNSESASNAAATQAVESAAWPDRDSSTPAPRVPAPSGARAPGFWLLRH